VEATDGCPSPLVVIGLLGLSFALNAMTRRSPVGSLKKGNMNIVYWSLTHLVHKVFVLIRLGQRREYNFSLFCPVLFGSGTPYFFLFNILYIKILIYI
jgi:hypothetical protein